MTMQEDYLSVAEHVLDLARRTGADEAEVMLSSGSEFTVTIRRGAVEKLIEASTRTLGLRVFRGGRSSSTYSADFSPAAMRRFVDRAVELAAIADPDPHAGLPDWEERGAPPELRLYDGSVAAMLPDAKIAQASRCEQAAFDFDPRISNSDGASFSTEISSLLLLNSRGFSGSYESSSVASSVEVMADDGDGKKRNDYWYSAGRALDELEPPEVIGKRAAERALRKLGARKPATQTVPIVFDPQAAKGLLRTLAGAATGSALERRATFLLDRENQEVGSAALTVVDDALLPGRLGSRPFDDEGVASRTNTLFERGVFRGFLFDSYTARKTGHRSTGNCRRSIGGPAGVGISNLYLAPGDVSPDDILASVEYGLYVTDMMGFGVNLTTGDFSRGAGGLWIENGKLSYPVTEMTISGNLGQMLQDLEMVGSDLDWRGSLAAPTLKLRSMMVSGT
jgi:PmbA protein